MPMNLFKSLGLAAALVSAMMLAVPATGMADVTETVKKRQGQMKELGRSMKTIKDYLGGSGSAADVEAAARKMASIAPTMSDMFPKGSGMTEVSIEAEAKAEIWQDWDGFVKIWGTLETEANKMASLASSGVGNDQIGAQLGAIGKGACAACHEKFRKKK